MIFRLLKQILWLLQSLFWHVNILPKKTNYNFTIGIVTYLDRYDTYFKSLIKKISILFPNQQIIICVNGYHDEEKQEQYLKKIKDFCLINQNIKIITHIRPKGLSLLWNKLINNSKNEKVLILNDDIDFSPFFLYELIKKRTYEKDFSLINNTWSCFFISKKIFSKVGDFDERLKEVGMEDGDYELRMIINNIPISTTRYFSFKNLIHKTDNFSYGNEKENIFNKKYRKYNHVIFHNKWIIQKNESEGFYYYPRNREYFKLNKDFSE